MIEVTDRSDVQAVRCRETVNGLEVAIVTEDGVYVFEDGEGIVAHMESLSHEHDETPARLDDQRRTAEPVESAD